MIQQNFPTFSILAHLDRLNIVKETSSELHCTCPLCGENGFKVHKKTGKYGGFKCDCMNTPEGKKAVINAIAPRTSDRQEKTIRPKQVRHWIYRDRQGNPIVRVCREDFGDGRTPKRWQEHWNGQKWVSGLEEVQREEIPIYKYQEIQKAIAAGQTIFIAEGEPACDAFWELGIPATTNIGGAGKWDWTTSRAVGFTLMTCGNGFRSGISTTAR